MSNFNYKWQPNSSLMNSQKTYEDFTVKLIKAFLQREELFCKFCCYKHVLKYSSDDRIATFQTAMLQYGFSMRHWPDGKIDFVQSFEKQPTIILETLEAP